MTAEGVPTVLRILPINTPTLGDRSYLVHDGRVAFVVDPQRDIDRVLGLAAGEGVQITHVFETHIHNDYVTPSPLRQVPRTTSTPTTRSPSSVSRCATAM
jgi:glyoxylase-like metal-dependent hydrolase (beta-lactamase superfamily II)